MLATRRALVLAPMPLLTIALVVTNGLHGLIYCTAEVAPSGPFTILRVTYGPGFWLHAAYASGLMVVAATLLAGELARPMVLQRRPAAAAIGCAIAPSIGANMRVFEVGPWPGIDFGPFALLLTSAILLWALGRQQVLALVPIARETVIEGLRDAVFVLDLHDPVVDLNPAARRLLTVAPAKAIGQPLATLLTLPPAVIASGEEPGEVATTITLGAGAARRDYDLTITPLITRGHYRGGVAILRDVTERVRTTARIAFLDDALALAREGTSDPAILFIDLDGFKAVNDTRGHASGDRLLGAVAERMRHCLGPDDLLARLGGDEFTVLLAARPQDAAASAVRITAALDRPFPLPDGDVRVAASIGIAFYPLDGRSAATLLAAADAAMYPVKTGARDAERVSLLNKFAPVG